MIKHLAIFPYGPAAAKRFYQAVSKPFYPKDQASDTESRIATSKNGMTLTQIIDSSSFGRDGLTSMENPCVNKISRTTLVH